MREGSAEASGRPIGKQADDAPVEFIAAIETGSERCIYVFLPFQGRGTGQRLLTEATRRSLRLATLTTDLPVPFNAYFYRPPGFAGLADHELSDDLRASLERLIASGPYPARRIAMALCN